MASVEDLRIDAPPPRPRRRGPSATPWLLLAGLLLFLWWMAGRPLPAGLKLTDPADAPPVQPAAATSSTDAAAGGAASTAPGPPGSFSAGGYIEVIPPEPRLISPLFAGKVSRVYVTPGDIVTQGQLVAELDSTLLRQQASVLSSRVALAQSQLKLTQAGFRNEEVLEAQGAVDRVLARVDRARADAQRAEKLFASGVVPRAEYDAAQSELHQAEAELKQAQALLDLKLSGSRQEEVGISQSELNVARAELRQVQSQIAQCQLRAPAGGVVYEVLIPEGGWADPSASGDNSASVVSIFNPRSLRAYADVNQRDSLRVSLGQSVELTTDAKPQEPILAVVDRIMPQANLQKNTVRVIIRILEVPEYLKPEMNVKVSFLAAEDETAVAVSPPATADAAPASPGQAGATP